MSKNIVIVDYQLGNLFSVAQACSHLGHAAKISSRPEDVRAADYLILPGVGAFGDAMKNLTDLNLVGPIEEHVRKGRPFMGVCLGLQLLLTESEEFGSTKGLNLIPGTVRRFEVQETGGKVHKVPQIQWNVIEEPSPGKWSGSPLAHCRQGDHMYFVHSYFAQPDDERWVLARTTYGRNNYCSAVIRDNVFATQFHPEKSGVYGVEIYRAWLNQNL